MDTRREQIIDIIKREFIGPDPINRPGMIQDNGEEILHSDPPKIRYIAGVLFPQKVNSVIVESDVEPEIVEDDDSSAKAQSEAKNTASGEYLQEAEELMNLSNSYEQSALSITVATKSSDRIKVSVSAGTYISVKTIDPITDKETVSYPRIPISWDNEGNYIDLPDADSGIRTYTVIGNDVIEKLTFAITFRYAHADCSLYTFTLKNSIVNNGEAVKNEDCFFQVGFSLKSESGFHPIPENEKLNINDNDFLSNQMMYRNVNNYAIGHGCAATWEETEAGVMTISTSIFPEYEIKPIVPSNINGVSLEMYKLSDCGNKNDILSELEKLCSEYGKWIESLKIKALTINDEETAKRHIEGCEECLKRMRDGIKLLESDDKVLLAFQLMNRAMLLQQLHYNLPLQRWTIDDSGKLYLEEAVNVLPNINDRSTWYDRENRVYGKWRPFQLAFVLINLRSMYEADCPDRSIVDLIWFPTGGGKTEAYLGLSAYTIFIRRLLNKDNAGTAILMRYTLRLLTAQQYERASAMICACESIRKENEELLGNSRISIGLWVGGETSPNSMTDAVKAENKLLAGTDDVNPFVMLKCPWCGAQMGVVSGRGRDRKTPGYKVIRKNGQKRFVFQCSNTAHGCDFSKDGFELPLSVIDEDIYDNPPTLLLGTVDKFAMLPYRPEAQSVFGIKNGRRITAPDLIIQDELHLISGPLGSMVGHYETMIDKLCTFDKGRVSIKPKIIASTATISRASEQCNALYCCGKNNVKQFPPSGLDAGDSFFAVEDKNAAGRRYVGILANAASSIATTMVRLYASLLYAAKEIDVADESDRDGYWTNVGYFNSIRELGQTETWIHADIDEYLHIIYKRRYEDKDEGYRSNRRYIYSDEELTSRIRSDKIPFSLQKLGILYPSYEKDKMPVDICLATNMISVGVDVPRLGLMTVAGQPKTTSEYIQATSRVGRNKKSPGLVFTVFNPGKPRDKSHYEQFRAYHSRIYCNVEPTSVTPFSAPVRERALHALIIGMIRLEGNDAVNSNPPSLPSDDSIQQIKDIIQQRILGIDPDELVETLDSIDTIIDSWEIWEPQKYQDFSGGDELPLMFPSGTIRNAAWGEHRGFPTPTSMRSVDASCEAFVLESGYHAEDE